MTPDPNYRVVFDIAQAGYQQGWFPLFGLLFVLVGALLAFAPSLVRWLLPAVSPSFMRVFGLCFFWFALFVTVLATVGTGIDYLSLRNALESGDFTVVEGEVRNFRPMPAAGRADESFDVGGVSFQYSSYAIKAGFNHTAPRGPIREGLRVRIAHRDNRILRLEIRADGR